MGSVKRKNIVGTVVVCVLILTVFIGNFLYDISETPRIVHTKMTKAGKGTVGEIFRRVTIEQEVPYHAGDCGISIKFATYGRRNLGNVRVKIVGETSGFVYADITEPVYSLTDNTFMDFSYVEDCPQEEETLKVRITATSTIGHAVTVWTTDNDALKDCSLVVNGKEMESDLAMQSIAYSDRVNFAWPILVLCVFCIILAMIILPIDRIRLENKYLLIALSLGLIYTIVMTPLSIPDEQTHYQSAFKLSNILCCKPGDSSWGKSFYFDYHNLSGHNNTGFGYDRIMNELFEAPSEDQMGMVPFVSSIGYLPMLLPQAIGLSIGQLLGTNFLITFYLGRLTNLLFYIGCAYIAIKITPRFKLLFFMTGIMPMALHQAASYSYDTFINGMSLLLIAFFLYAVESKKPIPFRKILYIAVIGTLLAPAKIIYASLLFIMFAIPAKRFVDKKRYILSLATVFLSAALIIVLLHINDILSVSSIGMPSTNWEGGYNYSIADILERPLDMLRVFYLTFRTLVWSWFEQAIGRVMSGQTMVIDQWIVTIYSVLMLLSSFDFKGERTLTARERWVYAVAALLPVLMLMFIMLISWTSNTHDLILGVQGRYFIPCIAVFFMCFNSRMARIKRPIDKYIIMTGVMINVYAMQFVMFKSFLINV